MLRLLKDFFKWLFSKGNAGQFRLSCLQKQNEVSPL